ncbi:hypothetical protein TV01_0134 [Neisseria flavescens]|nr:hypothetical protein TV01_0134 [Neisseria flavescens]
MQRQLAVVAHPSPYKQSVFAIKNRPSVSSDGLLCEFILNNIRFTL